MPLTGEQRKKLREGVIRTYCEPESLQMFLGEEMDIDLEAIARGERYETQVYNLIKHLESEGRLGEFIAAIARDKPQSPFTAELRQLFPEIFGQEITDCKKLYRHLLKLGYERQVEEFVSLIQSQSIGAFVIHGSLHHGQRWLLNRLVYQYLPDNLNPHKICIEFSRAVGRTDIASLWEELGRDCGLRESYEPRQIVKKIYRRWQTENILIAIHDIHLMPQNYLETFVQEFWHPLVKCSEEEGEKTSSYKLLMFLIDYDGSVEKLEGIFTETVDPVRPEQPLRPPAISKFTEAQVVKWILDEYEYLPKNLTYDFKTLAKTIIKKSDQGIPEWVLKEIFSQCDYDFKKEMTDLWKL